MFWIPICFVAVIIFIIRNANNSRIKRNIDEQLMRYEYHYRIFEDKTRLTSDERWEIEQKSKSPEEAIRLVHDFMNDQDKLWDKFAYSETVNTILAAKMGKIYKNPYLDQTCLFTANPRVCSVRKAYEMNERFLLRVEEELVNHGIITTLVANYNGKDYESVRSHVQNHGYIENPGRVSYRWSNALVELEDKFAHY